MDAHTNRRKNLIALSKEAGTKAELARRTGVNEVYLSQVLGDRNMGSDVARRLEQGMGKERGWMDADHSNEEDRAVSGAMPLYWVPEISWLQAGEIGFASDAFTPGVKGTSVPTIKKISDRAFALTVEGDSMVNPHGRPSYPPGSKIIVDPERQWASGDRVVVKIESQKVPTFKQIITDAGKVYLKPLNPQYPATEMTETMKVIGVVVQTLIDE